MCNGTRAGFCNGIIQSFGIGNGQGDTTGLNHEKVGTLNCMHDQQAVLVKRDLFENHSQDARYKGPLEICPMLSAQMGTGGNNQPIVCETFSKVHRVRSEEDATTWRQGGVANTLNTFDIGEVRTNELVVGKTYCLQGDGIDRADTAGCNGKGVKEEIGYTLNTMDRHGVAYTIKIREEEPDAGRHCGD